jgi:hypothetical protein
MKVRVVKYEPDHEVAPQAIIWRRLKYFTLVVREGEDDLDRYEGASFIIGNSIRFDLRNYRGHIHRKVTVTLYLPDDLREEKKISETIGAIIKTMAIPAEAIAWKRGQKFKFGNLERSKADRLLEPEARVLVLKIAARQPKRSASLAKLREEIPKLFDLSTRDKMPSPSRNGEPLWHTSVRNAVSSHATIFAKNWAKKTPGGLRVTKEGLDYLESIGFWDSSISN